MNSEEVDLGLLEENSKLLADVQESVDVNSEEDGVHGKQDVVEFPNSVRDEA